MIEVKCRVVLQKISATEAGASCRITMKILVLTYAIRALLFGLLWWVLTDGAMDSWYVGVPSIIAATLASVALLPPSSWSIVGIIRFAPFFVWHSLKGGADVAWRALHPGLPIAPDLFDYHLRLPPGRPRELLITVINLLPGTLSAAVSADTLQVHALTKSSRMIAELMAVEQHVAHIFGISLIARHAGDYDAKV